MNKQRHRIVFNRARGQLMAVAETAGSQRGGASGQSEGPGTTAHPGHLPALTLCLMLAIGAVSWLQPTPALGQIRADASAPGNQQATVLQTGNGVPLVNIQTPSAAGVSRNVFSQFDVAGNGAILNNSRTNVSTQLGGWVQGNPWLAAGSARVILGEITSGQPSQLRGFMEVAGQRAQVVIANPAGITCDGCGFINASRSTLTTGTPVFNGGNLDAYLVRGGQIDITGAGLQSSGSDHTDLIARAVLVNAGIHAQRLQVVTGVNQVSANSDVDRSALTPLAASQAQGAAPAWALDTAHLGGMYANKIVLVGTEQGVGVRNAGDIGASAGNVLITVDGELHNTGAGRILGNDVGIAATRLVQGPAQVSDSGGTQTRTPVIAARQRLDIGAANVLNQDGSLLFSSGDLAVGGNLDASGRATGQADSVRNSAATIEALGGMNLNARNLDNLNGGFSTQVVEVSRTAVQEYQVTGAAERWAPDQANYRHDPTDVDKINPLGSGERDDFTRYDYTRVVTTTEVTASKPGNIVAGGDMVVQAQTVNNTDSRMLAGGSLNMGAASVNNTATPGEQITTETGSATHFYRIKKKGQDDQGLSTTAYAPPAAIQALNISPQVSSGGTAPSSVPGASSPAALPGNGLLQLNPNGGPGPLVEGDPRFTNYRQWLSSDALLAQLAYDPVTVQKRLGDGFYEQKLVRDQVAQLTGRRFLQGYGDDEVQYQALMDQGATVARQWGLRPGVSLSSAQVAQLTSDIVWLEATTVKLPSGQSVEVLQPRVYLRPRSGDLRGNGDLIAANNLNLQVTGDVINTGGLGARQVLNIDAANLRNLGGSLNAQNVRVSATQDIDIQGGSLQAQDELSLRAGRDIQVASTTRSAANAQGSLTHIDRVAHLHVSEAAGRMLIQAGRDASLNAAQVTNQGAAGNTEVIAGRDLGLGTVQTGDSHDITWDAKNRRQDRSSQDVGSTLATQGDIRLQAGRDLSVVAGNVHSEQGALQASAAGQVRVDAGLAQQSVDETHHSTGSGFLSKSSRSTRDTLQASQAQGSTLSAASVSVQAGQDVVVRGSNVVSDTQTSLRAGRDVQLQAAQNTEVSSHTEIKKQSGLMGTGGGVGFAVGSRTQATEQDQQRSTAAASTVGSTQGDVSIQAGRAYRQTGSDLIAAQGNIDVSAQSVDIEAARESTRSDTRTSFKQSGVSLSLSNPVVDAVQKAEQMRQASKQTSDSRMKALAAATTALTALNAAGDVAKNPGAAGGANLSLSLGSSQSRSSRSEWQDGSAASRVQAQGDVRVSAQGAGQASDLRIKGSDISAQGDISLLAGDQLELSAAQHTAGQRSTNSHSSASVGASIGTDGLMLTASASGGRGKADGDDSSWRNTHVQAGQQLSLQSGGDTTLKGAVARGERVQVDVGGQSGGQLHIESLQDTSRYASSQQSAGGSVSVGYGQNGGSASYSQSRVNSDFASVAERSGIEAGDQGFQVTVNGRTVLTGAVIASSEAAVQAGKNRLSTTEVITQDIENHADYEAQAFSVSVGTKAGQTSAGVGQASGSARSTTKAGVSGLAGDSSVRTGDAQQGIAPIFDQDRVTQDVGAQVAITSEFGKQAAKGWGEYANKKFEQALKEGDEKALACWGPDGSCRAAGHAVVGGLTGNVGGAVSAGASSMVAPHVQAFLQEQGLSEQSAKLVTQLSAYGMGSQVGGTQGGSAALNEAGNNAVVAIPLLVEGIVAAGSTAARACLSSPACQNALRLGGAAALAKVASMVPDEQLHQIPGFGSAQPQPALVVPPRMQDVQRAYGTPPLNDPRQLKDWLSGVLDGIPADEAQKWARGLITTLPAADQQRYSDFILNAVQDNAVSGSRREREVTKDLQAQYPQGSVQNQQYLRDKDGNIVIDPNTGTARRLDHVVVLGGKVVDVVETTSLTARKDAQIDHEIETRKVGGVYVRDRETGKLVEVPSVSRIERRP